MALSEITQEDMRITLQAIKEKTPSLMTERQHRLFVEYCDAYNLENPFEGE